MKNDTATIVGFIVAPFIAAVSIAAKAPIEGGEDSIAWGLIPAFYFFSFLPTVIFGAPAFFVPRQYELITWWSSVLVGVVAACIFSTILRLPSTPNVSDFVPRMAIGAVSAFAFWVIWRIGNANR
ncbi:MAG: hypothetical protein V4582_10960 [Pseudomonadota bacterium]